VADIRIDLATWATKANVREIYSDGCHRYCFNWRSVVVFIRQERAIRAHSRTCFWGASTACWSQPRWLQHDAAPQKKGRRMSLYCAWLPLGPIPGGDRWPRARGANPSPTVGSRANVPDDRGWGRRAPREVDSFDKRRSKGSSPSDQRSAPLRNGGAERVDPRKWWARRWGARKNRPIVPEVNAGILYLASVVFGR
jgi:hypothetical protein